MDMTPEQKQEVAQWVKSGCGLAEVQRKLESEFGLKMTYMDVRFLVIDLGVEPDKKAPPTVVASPGKTLADASSAGTGQHVVPDDPAGDGLGGVSVELDRIMKPGAVVSGTVVFSDGVSASWSLDQLGRLGIDPGKAGYRPTEEDVQDFQLALRNALASRGF